MMRTFVDDEIMPYVDAWEKVRLYITKNPPTPHPPTHTHLLTHTHTRARALSLALSLAHTHTHTHTHRERERERERGRERTCGREQRQTCMHVCTHAGTRPHVRAHQFGGEREVLANVHVNANMLYSRAAGTLLRPTTLILNIFYCLFIRPTTSRRRSTSVRTK